MLSDCFNAQTLCLAALILFASASVAAVVFFRRQRTGNLLTHALCMAGSAAAGSAAVIALLGGSASVLRLRTQAGVLPFALEFRLDGLSAWFLLALSVVAFCVSLYSIGYVPRYFTKGNTGLINGLYALFLVSLVLVLTSDNMAVFYLSWEAMSLLSFFLVVYESEHEENRKAGFLYIVMTHVGAALLLSGFLLIYGYTDSLSLRDSAAALPEWARNLAFVLFLAGFGVKAGAVPLHIWLPRAHPAAPSNVSALMSGIMLKTAVYGLIRFAAGVLGVEDTWWGVALLVIGAVSAVTGVAYAFAETNIKRLLAYSSIENIGIILIGLGTSFIAQAAGHRAVAAFAMTASLVHTFNHALFKGALFLGAGSIHHATHTKDLERMGGLVRRMPYTAVLALGACLSAAALIPFNGFTGEWLTFQSLFAVLGGARTEIRILAMLSVSALALAGALAMAVYVKMYGIAFLGRPRSESAEHAREAPVAMIAGTGLLVALCLLAGVFPSVLVRLAGRVAGALAGQPAEAVPGGDLLSFLQPAVGTGDGFSPAVLLAMALGIAALALVWIRAVGGPRVERRHGTWDCGFKGLDERMQYSATGFSKPVRIVFRLLFRPRRTTRLSGGRPYHPESIEYRTTMENVFETRIYIPLHRMLRTFSKKTKMRVQTGRIQTYLLYILAVVLLLMAYNLVA